MMDVLVLTDSERRLMPFRPQHLHAGEFIFQGGPLLYGKSVRLSTKLFPDFPQLTVC